MKKNILLLATLFLLATNAISQHFVRIHKSDGTKLEFPTSIIDSITFFTSNATISPSSVIIGWNQITVNATKKANLNSNLASRIDAIAAIAVYDAVNSIRNYGSKYHYFNPPGEPASAQAATAQAAHDVLVNYFPSQQIYLDSALSATINLISEAGIIKGQEIGKEAAQDIIALRQNDHAEPNTTYTGPTTPGVGEWRPTPSGFAAGINSQWGAVTPFLLSSPDQFRPSPPPAINSSEYQTALDEVHILGSINSRIRTDDQVRIAQFYKQDAELTVNEAARKLITNYNSSIEEAALILLLVNIAEADARIAVWDAKYFYNYWRPVTSLNAEPDGSVSNNYAAWSPLLATPPHPSYPSGHSATVSAGFAILKNFFGDINTLTLSTTTPGEPARTIPSLSVGESENGLSRIYGGIHYSFDNITGQSVGKKVANYVLINGPKKRL